MQKSSCESPNTTRSPATSKMSSSPVRQIRDRDGEIRKFKANMTEKQHEIDLLKNEVEELKRKIADLINDGKKYRKIETEKRTLQTEVQKLNSTIETLQTSVDDKKKEIEKLQKDTKRFQQVAFDLELAEKDKISFEKEIEELRKSLEKKEKAYEILSKKILSLERSTKEKDEEYQISLDNLNSNIKKLEIDCGHYRDECDQLQYLAQDAERARTAETQLRSKLIQKQDEIETMEKTLIEEQEKFRNSTLSLKIENEQLMELNFVQKEKLEESLSTNRSLEERILGFEKAVESLESDKISITKVAEQARIVEAQIRSELTEKQNEIEAMAKTFIEEKEKCQNSTLLLKAEIEQLMDLNFVQKDKLEESLSNNRSLEERLLGFEKAVESLESEKILITKDAEQARTAEAQLRTELIERQNEIEAMAKSFIEEKEKCQNSTSSLKAEIEQLMDLNFVQKEKLEESVSTNRSLEERILSFEKAIEFLESDKISITKEAEQARTAAEAQLRTELIEKQNEIEAMAKTFIEEKENYQNSTSSLKAKIEQLMDLNFVQKDKLEESVSTNRSLEERILSFERAIESLESDKISITKEAEQARIIEAQIRSELTEKQNEIEAMAKTFIEEKEKCQNSTSSLKAEIEQLMDLNFVQKDKLEESLSNNRSLEERLLGFEKAVESLESEKILITKDAEQARTAEAQLRTELIERQNEIEAMAKTFIEEKENYQNSTSSLKAKIEQLMDLNFVQKDKLEESVSTNRSLEERILSFERAIESLESDKISITKEAEQACTIEAQIRSELTEKQNEIEAMAKTFIEEKEKCQNSTSSLKAEIEQLMDLNFVQKEKLEESVSTNRSLEERILSFEKAIEFLESDKISITKEAEQARTIEAQIRSELTEKQNEIEAMAKTFIEEKEKCQSSTSSLKAEIEQLMDLNFVQKEKLAEVLSKNRSLEVRLVDLEKALESVECAKISIAKNEEDLLKSLEDKEKTIEGLQKKVLSLVKVENDRSLERNFAQKQKLDESVFNFKSSDGRISRLSSETFQSIRSADAFFGTRPPAGGECEDEASVMIASVVTPVPTANGNEIEFVVPSVEPVNNFTIFKRPITPIAARLRFDSSNEDCDSIFQSTTKKETPASSVTSSACSTPSDWSRRLTILNDRNQQVPQHLRSFYPVETQQLPMDVREDDLRNSEHYQPPATVQHLRSRENFKSTSSKSVQRSPFQTLRKMMGKTTKLSAEVVINNADLPDNAKVKKSALSYNLENSPIAKRSSKKSATKKKSAAEQSRKFFRTTPAKNK